jgi:putative molybdopterin biosynthesis protein
MQNAHAVMRLLSTKEVAKFLGVTEKQVYVLITDKRLPATKVTGKWLFPQHLVEQWLDNNTMHHPAGEALAASQSNVLILAGSNDILLERCCSLFSRQNPGFLAAFANLGSLGGLKALRQGLCHVACSHLLQEDEHDYNFAFAAGELEQTPVIVSFCSREQGLLVLRGNRKDVRCVADIVAKRLRMVNRPLGTGTRLLLDRELQKAGLQAQAVIGYTQEVNRHIDVGLEILAGRADAGLAIRAVCSLLPLDFVPLRWERFDLLLYRTSFFEKPFQAFLNMLHSGEFKALGQDISGYDTSQSGSIRYPGKGT